MTRSCRRCSRPEILTKILTKMLPSHPRNFCFDSVIFFGFYHGILQTIIHQTGWKNLFFGPFPSIEESQIWESYLMKAIWHTKSSPIWVVCWGWLTVAWQIRIENYLYQSSCYLPSYFGKDMGEVLKSEGKGSSIHRCSFIASKLVFWRCSMSSKCLNDVNQEVKNT